MAKRNSPKRVSKTQKKRPKLTLKKALILLGTFLAVFTVYQVLLYLQWAGAIHLYSLLLLVFASIYIVYNRGVMTLPDEKSLPKEWSKEERETFLAEQIRRRGRSEILLYLIVSFVMTLFIDVMYLFATLNLGWRL